MTPIILEFLFSGMVVVLAGLGLTRSVDVLSQLTKISGAVAGILFLATATSLPELSVSVSAVLISLPDLAVGGLIGSSLFNLLILGVLDMTTISRGRMLSRISAHHAVAGLVSIFLTTIAALSILTKYDGSIGNLSIHIPLIILTYILGFILVHKADRSLAASSVVSDEVEIKIEKLFGMRVGKTGAIVAYTFCALIIFLAAPRLSASAGKIAEITGISQTFIGTTLVALATSLPELTTTFAAVRMRSFDLAIGNIFGSNSFNMLIIAGADMAFPGALLASVSQTHLLTCLGVILVSTIAVLSQLYPIEKRIRLVEPDALAVIVLVLLTLFTIYQFGG